MQKKELKRVLNKNKSFYNDLFFYDIVHDVTDAEWIELSKDLSCYSVFQSLDMFRFWQGRSGCEPFIYTVKNSDEKFVAICSGVILETGKWPVSALSKRAIIFGGPAYDATCDTQVLFQFLIDKINEQLAPKVIFIEIRNLFDYSDFSGLFTTNRWKYIPYQNYLIEIKNEEEIFKQFNSEKRRQIRKAFREGIEISYSNTEDNINGVYQVIQRIYTEKVKKPLPKIEFFRSLCDCTFASVAAIIYKNNVIGGGFFLYDKHTIFDWYRGGLDSEYKHQYPSTLAAWAVLKYGIENNYQSFDFMGAGIKGEEYGVRKFKSQFGGELVEYGRFLKICKPQYFQMGKFGLRLLKLMNK